MTISKKIIAAAVLAVALLPFSASAAKLKTVTTKTHTESYVKHSDKAVNLSGFYVAGQVGYNDPNGDFLNENAVYAGQFGYRFNPNFRVEGDVSYRGNSVDGGPFISGRSRLTNYMINGWYDFANNTPFTPYVGGGVGLASAKAIVNAPVAGVTASAQDNDFVYQLGAGVAYKLTSKVDLTADYRYINTNDFDDIGGQYIANEYRVGARYNF